MKRRKLDGGTMAFAAAAMLCASQVMSQPPDGPGRKAPPPPARDGDRKDALDGPKGPPRFELGQVFPPPLLEQLELTPAQEKKLDAIKIDLKGKLDRMLTAEQKTKIENFRPRGPRGPDGNAPPPPPREPADKTPPPPGPDGKTPPPPSPAPDGKTPPPLPPPGGPVGPDRKAPPPPRDDDRRDNKAGPKGAPRFELGQIFPPRLQDELELTKAQEKTLDGIRTNLKSKLSKLLTPEQMTKVENFRPRGPGGPGGPDGPDGKGPPPPRRDDPKDGPAGKLPIK